MAMLRIGSRSPAGGWLEDGWLEDGLAAAEGFTLIAAEIGSQTYDGRF